MRRTRKLPGTRASSLCAAIATVLGALAIAGLGTPAPGHAAIAPALPQVPPLYLGLDSYLNLGKLSYLEIGDRVASQTAASTGGGYRIVHEKVLLRQPGLGIVTSMRMQQALGSPWTLTTDGSTLGFAATDLGQTTGLLSYPLALNPSQSEGSSIVYTPVPYEKTIELSASARNSNADVMYRKLPHGTPLPADSALSAANPAMHKVESLLKSAGTDIAPANLPSMSGTVDLGPAGTPTTLATINGANQIRAITITVPFAEAVQLGNSMLRISWDGESTPSVDVPLKYIAGDGAGVYKPDGRQLVQGLLAGITSDGSTYLSYNLYYPMPFTSRASIAIVPSDASSLLPSVRWSVSYQPFSAPPTWWGHFHANYTRIAQPTPEKDMTFLDYKGSGKLVGTVVNFGAVGNVLEGDPQIYVDNSGTPQIPYTGTEEWGLGGNYWNGGTQTSLPLGGMPSATNNPPGTDVDGAALYRFLIADSVPFNNRIIVDWEHGGVNQTTTPYSAAMMWYGNPLQTAVRTDQVVIANAVSAGAHHYASPGQSTFPLTAAYEYQPYMPLITGTVAKTSRSATFTLRLARSNVGAFLRRTFDSCVGGQRAGVYVDGKFAGTWLNYRVSSGVGYDGHERCWRDDDFPLPASMTAGRSSITITVRYSGKGTYWTASDYKLYSFVM